MSLSLTSLCQTLVKLNPKLEPMLETIQANRSNWEELNRKRQCGHSISAPASPCCGGSNGGNGGGGGDVTPEAIGGTATKTSSTPCCSSSIEAEGAACKPVT